MVLRAALLLDQVLEELLPQRRVLAAGVHAGDVRRKRRDVRVVGDRVLAQVLRRQAPLRPELVEGVIQQVLLADQGVEGDQELFARHFRASVGRRTSADVGAHFLTVEVPCQLGTPGQGITCPPSATIAWPVTERASSEAR